MSRTRQYGLHATPFKTQKAAGIAPDRLMVTLVFQAADLFVRAVFVAALFYASAFSVSLAISRISQIRFFTFVLLRISRIALSGNGGNDLIEPAHHLVH